MVSGVYLQPSSNQAAIQVVIPTTLTIIAPSQVNAGAAFQVSGVLTSNPGGGIPISGALIQVVFAGQTVNVTTDSNGNYLANLAAPSAAGSDVVTATFSGSGGYQPSSATATIQVLAVVATSLSIALSATTVTPGQSVTASGTLTRNDTGGGVPSQPVVIALDGAMVTTVNTDASGNYSATITAPSVAGTHTVSASFAGGDPPAEAFTMLLYAEAVAPLGMQAGGSALPAVGLALLLAGIGFGLAASRKRR